MLQPPASLQVSTWRIGRRIKLLVGDWVEAIRLTIEFDPHPLFNARHMSKASKETQRLAKKIMDDRMPRDQSRLVPKIAWKRLKDFIRTGK